AIASAHNSGRRKSRIIQDSGSGLPPKFSPLFDSVATVRRVHLGGFPFPENPDPKTLEIFQNLAWRMLRAAAHGDSDSLREVADAVEMFNGLRSEELETPLNDWQDI